MINHIISFFLKNKLITWILLLLIILSGLVTSPFNFNTNFLPKDAVNIDALPDIGENQQIVFTQWTGNAPQTIEDQISYPLTTNLLGIPGVKTIRSNSMFGFSSINIIFEDDVPFYWSRSRILEKLNSLPSGLLPQGVQSTLGPDANALGQVFWYTLEGRDTNGKPTGGWNLNELRSIQDYYIKYVLSSAKGVSEVASIGGFVQEYQIDVLPDKMKNYHISLNEVMKAVKESNQDIGAQTLEINMVEYFVRGLGYIKSIEDIENCMVKWSNGVPIRVKDIAKVYLGPAPRRGILDKSGAEAVGAVVVARYGANPLEVINNVKQKIKEIEKGLPSKTLVDGTVSQLKIVPFYDRTDLIYQTIDTLREALTLEILITIIVIILMLYNIKSSILVSSILPVAVLLCFTMMRYTHIDANIVALSGIAIAIGTMVDMGIVLVESILSRLDQRYDKESITYTVYKATTEVAPAIITAVATTIISFLPVFAMESSEGKLFKPLAFTKTYALFSALVVALMILPTVATLLLKKRNINIPKYYKKIVNILWLALSIFLLFTSFRVVGVMSILMIGFFYIEHRYTNIIKYIVNVKYLLYALFVAWFLSDFWSPLGADKNEWINYLFVMISIGVIISFFYVVYKYYEKILRYLLHIKYLFLALIIGIVVLGVVIFKNIGKEFMPSLDEGSFLLMPTSMPYSGVQSNTAYLRMLDMAVTAIPEVDNVVGKAGRVDSSLDPAPMSMFENMIFYKSEYKRNDKGEKIKFKINDEGEYIRDKMGKLIPDEQGRYFRQWRDHIYSPDDIWQEIVKSTHFPGLTSSPKLQPIEARLVMLQTGMRAPMGIKIKGSDLQTIERFGQELERYLKEVPEVNKATVFADKIVAKPYINIVMDREQIARYGLTLARVQKQLQAAVGGMNITTTIEGRERYNVRIRYPRELRNSIDKLKNIYISNSSGQQITLDMVSSIRYDQGPQSIKSEDTFLISYVLFDKTPSVSESTAVERAQLYLEQKIAEGVLVVPSGVTYNFAGSFEQQQRANKRLSIVLPISLMLIFLILYFQFRSITMSLMIFSAVFVAFSGGFIMIWLYNQDWFMNFNFLGENMRSVFQIKNINLSVAIWVGFLALFGIATDDGVLISTYLKNQFENKTPKSIAEIHDMIVHGGLRRIRPALMTTATTIIALLPVLSSHGRGSDIMIPMAIPSFGGMLLQTITMFTVPVMYAIWKELKFKKKTL